MRIAFVHFTATRNVGDLKSGPHQYFPFDGDVSVHDVRALPKEPVDAVVVGGGAVGAWAARPHAQRWMARVRRRVAWGVGRSVHGATGPQPVPTDAFDLYGTREYPSNSIAYFVPCVSCMMPQFDMWHDVEPVQEAVLFYNARKPRPAVRLPSLSNEHDVDMVFSMMASARTVVTNSYHGAYWATLLGRRAIIVRAYSSKFTCYPWPIPARTDTDWRASLPEADTHPEALAACRAINTQFYERVKEVLYA